MPALVPTLLAAAGLAAAPGLSTTASTHRAGARVALALSFPAELVCGRPTGRVVVTFPRALPVPRRIARGAVTIAGRTPAGVSVRGRTVVVEPPGFHGLMCHSVTVAAERIVFARSAGLRNPAAGRYAISVTHAGRTFRGSLAIRSIEG